MASIILMIMGCIFIYGGVYSKIKGINSVYIFTRTPRPSSAKPKTKQEIKIANIMNYTSIIMGIALILSSFLI